MQRSTPLAFLLRWQHKVPLKGPTPFSSWQVGSAAMKQKFGQLKSSPPQIYLASYTTKTGHQTTINARAISEDAKQMKQPIHTFLSWDAKFEDYNLHPRLVESIKNSLGLSVPSRTQELVTSPPLTKESFGGNSQASINVWSCLGGGGIKAIPEVQSGDNLVIAAETGSGKTLAYLVCLLLPSLCTHITHGYAHITTNALPHTITTTRALIAHTHIHYPNPTIIITTTSNNSNRECTHLEHACTHTHFSHTYYSHTTTCMHACTIIPPHSLTYTTHALITPPSPSPTPNHAIFSTHFLFMW